MDDIDDNFDEYAMDYDVNDNVEDIDEVDSDVA